MFIQCMILKLGLVGLFLVWYNLCNFFLKLSLQRYNEYRSWSLYRTDCQDELAGCLFGIYGPEQVCH